MRLLSTFASLATLTSNTENANFPVENVQDLDPHIRWVATQYAVDEWVKCDFGGATVLTDLFLNRCNFGTVKIQGHASDSWADPDYNETFTLVQDQAANRKGFFELTAFNYRWLRILIEAGQTLDNSEAYPAIGNLITGQAAEMPIVSNLTWDLQKRFFRFETDAGSLTKTQKGYARHILSLSVGDTLANVKALSKTWSMGVLWADVGAAEDAWLVYPPENWNNPVRSINDANLTFQLDERA